MVTVQKTSNGSFKTLLDRLRGFKEQEVLVGIPAEKALRKNDEMGNATLAFIQTNGSPLHHIPARPFLVPGIQKVRQLIAQNLGEAAKATIQGDQEKAKRYLKRAGQLGANSVRRYILDGNNLAPNAPSTIKAKGSSVPLVDEAQLVKAITYVVRDSGVDLPKEEKKKTIEDYGLNGKIKETEGVAESGAELSEIAEVAAIL